MRRGMSLLLAVVLLLSPGFAGAAAFDAQRAEALKKAVSESLSWYTDVSEAAGQGLTYEGDLKVVPREKFYEVTIPKVSFLSGAGFRLEMGDVFVHAVPEGAEAWAISAALPAKMTAYDASQAAIADVTLGGQTFAAVWVPALDVFTKIDADYRDFKISPRGDTPFNVYVAGIELAMNMARNNDGTWTGPHSLKVEGGRIEISGTKPAVLELRKLSSYGEYDRMPMDGVKNARRRVSELIKSDTKESRLSEEDIRAAIAALLKETAALPDNYAGTVEVQNLTLQAMSDNPEKPPIEVALPKLTFENRLKGLKQPKGAMSGRILLSGLVATGLPEPLGGLLPSDADLRTRIDNLPMQELARMFAEAVSASVQNDPAQKAKARQDAQAALSALPQTLATAGTVMTVQDSHLRARDLGATLDGRLTAYAATSGLPVLGNVNLTLERLDELIAEYRKQGATNPLAMRYVQGAIPLQLMGQLEKKPDGTSVRAYKFEFTQGGGMLLNGADVGVLGGLMGGMLPRMPAAESQPVQKAPAAP